MTIASLLAGAALLVAVGAWVRARRVARRVDELSEAYWELRYEHGQLVARVERLGDGDPAPAESTLPGPRPVSAFVPLSSLKR